MQTLAVLNPFGRIDQHIMDDSDVAGPILFFLIFGTSLLVRANAWECRNDKLTNCSYLASSTSATSTVSPTARPWPTTTNDELGLAFVGTILLHQILSLMSPPVNAAEAAPGDHGHNVSHLGSSLTFPRSASVLGYCLLPLVLVAIFGIIIPLDSLFGYLLTSLAIMWCAYSSSSMFTVVGKLQLLLAVYDCILTC